VSASPFLVLQTSLSPASLNPNASATLTADLTKNSAGTTIVTSPTLLDGLPATFSGSFGAFAQPSVGLVVAKASDVFTAGAGVGSASLSVTVDNQTLTSAVPVVLPQVTVDHNALSFAASTNGLSFLTKTAAQTVRLTQTGIGPVTWTAVSNSPWLVVSPASGSGSATLTVSVQFQYGLAESQNGSVTLTFTGAGNTAGPIGVTLTTLVAPTAPFGSFDTPQDGSTGLSGSIAVSGWALDDLQVTGVAICRDAVSGESATPDARCGSQPKLFIGNAVFIDGARPDVQAIYSAYPLSSRAGWGYLMLTNFLPNLGNGTYTIYAYASDADGHSGLLGSKTIACANSLSATPFGAIDTPGQGETVGGIAYANFGWVLAPAPAFADPPNGAGVDGAAGSHRALPVGAVPRHQQSARRLWSRHDGALQWTAHDRVGGDEHWRRNGRNRQPVLQRLERLSRPRSGASSICRRVERRRGGRTARRPHADPRPSRFRRVHGADRIPRHRRFDRDRCRGAGSHRDSPRCGGGSIVRRLSPRRDGTRRASGRIATRSRVRRFRLADGSGLHRPVLVCVRANRARQPGGARERRDRAASQAQRSRGSADRHRRACAPWA
jgi:hypothetical protein